MKKMRNLFALLALAVLVMPGARPAAAGPSTSDEHHVMVALQPVGGSGVSGFVNLVQVPGGGTRIHVMAFGLTPGQDYVSLYYDNNTCTLPGDELSEPYTGNAAGIGRTHGTADDDLDEVDSVSVRLNDANLTLMACAAVHP